MKQRQLNDYFNLLIKLAMSMVFSILTFFLIGHFLEKKLPLNGVFLIGFTLFGVAVGFMSIYYHLKKFL